MTKASGEETAGMPSQIWWAGTAARIGETSGQLAVEARSRSGDGEDGWRADGGASDATTRVHTVAVRRAGLGRLRVDLAGRRWMRDWRLVAAALAALACFVCALFSLPSGQGASDHSGGLRAKDSGILDGANGERVFELVEQRLDAAMTLGDREDAQMRGWSRAQMLALRDSTHADAHVAEPHKMSSLGVLKEQMMHLDVLRQKLAKMVATGSRLAGIASAGPAANRLPVGSTASSAASSAALKATFLWPDDVADEQRGGGRVPEALSGQTQSDIYVLDPLVQPPQLQQRTRPGARMSPVAKTSRALAGTRAAREELRPRMVPTVRYTDVYVCAVLYLGDRYVWTRLTNGTIHANTRTYTRTFARAS